MHSHPLLVLHQLLRSQNAAGCENIGEYPGVWACAFARNACDASEGAQPVRLAFCWYAGGVTGGHSWTASRANSLELVPGCGMAGGPSPRGRGGLGRPFGGWACPA